MNRGQFITIEGTEGVGKSTQLERIMTWFADHGIDALQTREPGGTPVGEKIRDLVLDTGNQLSHDAELLLIFAARADHWHRKI